MVLLWISRELQVVFENLKMHSWGSRWVAEIFTFFFFFSPKFSVYFLIHNPSRLLMPCLDALTIQSLDSLKDEMLSWWLHYLGFDEKLCFQTHMQNSLNPYLIFTYSISQSNLNLVVPTLCLQLPAWRSHSNMKYNLDDYAIFSQVNIMKQGRGK